LFNAWDNSPSHRENIVNTNYTDIGIAVVSGDFKGAQTTVVVQFFGSRTIALAKEPTSSSGTRPSLAQGPTVTTPQVSPSGQTLYGYFIEKGEAYPSFEERAVLFEEYDLGPASTYKGTVEQNTSLLNALIKTEKPSPKPEPEKPPVTKEPEEEAKPKVAEEVTPVKTTPEKEGALYKVLDFLANYFGNIIKNAFLVVFALVIISLSFEFVGQTGINYSNLCLKGGDITVYSSFS